MNDHFMNDPARFRLANELHARPFPHLTAPCRAIHLAVRPEAGEKRDPEADRARLIELIDKFGGKHPAPGAAFYSEQLGRYFLKWESHTEFVAYTIFVPELADPPFSDETIRLFPSDWLARLDGRVVSAALAQVEQAANEAEAQEVFQERLSRHLVSESRATAFVVDREALVATDFRLHENGFARIAVVAVDGVGPQRLGRIVQRLLEIESYKSFALTALPIARHVSKRVAELDERLSSLVGQIADATGEPRETLEALTRLAVDAEKLSNESAFRFGAAGAYEAIVNDRITALREERLQGRQLYSEFMKRRFDPAMRTCRSAERRLAGLSDRLARVSTLLSTRVNVAVETQNQRLLESMDSRAASQLRLQQTVEGLSVVAISYYALNLAAALVAPLAHGAGLDKTTVVAVLVLPVIGAVWWAVRRIRKRWER